MRGRPAALPMAGYQAPARVLLDEGRCTVRVISEDGCTSKDFDFTVMPVARALQVALAEAFDRRTGPSGTCKSISSANGCYYGLRTFTEYLSTLPSPPSGPAELRPGHLEGYRAKYAGQRTLAQRVNGVKRTLRAVTGVSDAFTVALRGGGIVRDRSPKVPSYRPEEFRLIMAAARREARATAARIREHRQLLDQWRCGAVDSGREPDRWQLGQALDHVETAGDVPRRLCRNGYRYLPHDLAKRWSVGDLIAMVHLTWCDAMPFVVLLAGLTGQNGSTIIDAPAAVHRPDGGAGGTPNAIVELVKPRRGHRSHMPVVLADLPDWLSTGEDDEGPGQPVSARDELHTPLGVFLLVRELTEPVRRITGTDRLMAVRQRKGFRTGRPLSPGTLGTAIADWSHRAGLGSVSSPVAALPRGGEVSLPRLRMTVLEQRQQAIAHTDEVLVNEYLGRDRGNIGAYQQVVSRALEEQVSRAKASALMPVLTADEVELAREHPETVAARHGMDSAVLKQMLSGELDTVLGACTDHHGGPHSPPGQPCRASFMRCLECPCARATPRHLPVQILVLDGLEAHRAETPPARWAQRFALPHAQLAELISRHPPAAVTRAREQPTPADRRLVERFLARELDHS
ncbi:hypothetical protein [Streptomyces beihaiensis]|uniref:Integrase n=1 Tax=Streptomyces beihaiensis TaxID=2984495 RepID=A0ABT3TU89_9ACTN|nr:hypothetical protein [Streptomyces beihaiensis]MCX3059650.1 hypothetical protein [Streptomyces beihaiensis]